MAVNSHQQAKAIKHLGQPLCHGPWKSALKPVTWLTVLSSRWAFPSPVIVPESLLQLPTCCGHFLSYYSTCSSLQSHPNTDVIYRVSQDHTLASHWSLLGTFKTIISPLVGLRYNLSAEDSLKAFGWLQCVVKFANHWPGTFLQAAICVTAMVLIDCR